MAHREWRAPLEVEHTQAPALPQAPVSVPVDFTRLLAAAGARGMADLASVRVEAGGRLLPAQFSPGEQFEAADRCTGTLVFLAPAAARWRGALLFGAEDDATVPRLPYPPRSYRRALPDGRIAPPAAFARMQLVPQPEGRLDVEEDGRLVTAYHHRASEPKPYLYPLIGPAGRGLTRLGHPHDPGETHRHHHSIWCGFRGVSGENFWEEPAAPRAGGVLRHQRFERLEDGPVFARFRALVHWETGRRRVLVERREVTVYRGWEARLLDFVLHYQGPDGAAVALDRTSFGFLAVRVAKSMGAFDGGGVIVNSEGGINEPGVFGKPARWCDYSGPVTEDAWNGIAFLDHPSNARHPTPWHVRPDGWMGAALCTQDALTIPAGGSLELRYRLYVHAADARRARVEAAWHDFAHPPRVALGPAAPLPREGERA
jgi:hypothetical protein